MEDLGMTSPTPFRFGDAQITHRYLELLNGMKVLIDEVVRALMAEYDLETSRPSVGDHYAWQDVVAGDLKLGIGIISAARNEENGPLWPFLYVYPGTARSSAAETALGAVDSEIAKWPGKCAYPERDQLKPFHSAWDWAEQIRAAKALWGAWFAALCAAKLVGRKGA
jgi:hypothetical protein